MQRNVLPWTGVSKLICSRGGSPSSPAQNPPWPSGVSNHSLPSGEISTSLSFRMTIRKLLTRHDWRDSGQDSSPTPREFRICADPNTFRQRTSRHHKTVRRLYRCHDEIAVEITRTPGTEAGTTLCHTAPAQFSGHRATTATGHFQQPG